MRNIFENENFHNIMQKYNFIHVRRNLWLKKIIHKRKRLLPDLFSIQVI